MPTAKPCLLCGKVQTNGARCLSCTTTVNRQRERTRRPRRSGWTEYDSAWRAIRLMILSRDSYRCYLCGGLADQVDHITPRSKGGSDTEDNLRACCKRCNSGKRDRLPTDGGRA